MTREMGESLEPRRLASSAERRLRQLRHDLVLQLYLRRGPLWEAVCDIRDRWNISAKDCLPPPVRGHLLPADAPDFEDHRERTEYVMRWQDEMAAIRAKVDLEPHHPTWAFSDYQLQASWSDFLSACVLYDPPDDELIAFASYGFPEGSVLSGGRFPTKANIEGLPEMVDPPVRSLWELSEVRDWYWKRVLSHIGERYLEPQDVDVEALLENVMSYIAGLDEEYRERYERYSKRYFIGVDDYTSLEDVKNAFQMIRRVQPAKGTKSPRDRLTALQCAILYDQHNQRDPNDKRRRSWTHNNLAEKFKLSSSRAAKDHIELGRKILDGKDPEKR
jgi:hypothetical protein